MNRSTQSWLLVASMGVAMGLGLSLTAHGSDELDDLFDLDAPIEGAVGGEAEDGGGTDAEAPVTGLAGGTSAGLRVSGYAEFAAAYTTADPERWSKLRSRLELAATGRSGGLRYKISGRVQADGAFNLEDDYYPAAVRRDQRRGLELRETYVDLSAGEWEFRLGKQNIVWGEAVGMFMADVVSSRDMREFVLPEFDAMRIPQWAARAEYFAGDTHLELIWIPYPSYDDIGKPGADFYPLPVPAGVPVSHNEPSRNLSNTNLGVKVSRLISGWDLAAFAYRSRDINPTLYALPTGLELRNDRITQFGATFSKDFGQFVLKGETVYTRGRSFNTSTPGAPFGLAASNTLEYVLGADIPLDDWRINLQYFGRYTTDHDPGFVFDRDEHGLTVLVNGKLTSTVEAEVLYAFSLNRHDYMLRPKLIWSVTQDWRAMLGADLFGGKPTGLFGRFDESDRVYVEVRRWF